jgi:lipid-A-disaccharide synthase-like uncharacterized protein
MTSIIIIGWLGAILYIVAYFLLTVEAISSSSLTYHFLNVFGALGLMINAIYLNDSPNIIVNLLWFLIAAGAINIQFRKIHKKKKADYTSDLTNDPHKIEN